MPVKSFIELAAIASDLERKDWSSQDVEVLEEKVKREQRIKEVRKKGRKKKRRGKGLDRSTPAEAYDVFF